MKKTEKLLFTDANDALPEATLLESLPILKLIYTRNSFISKFQSELRYTSLIDVVQYWRDYKRPGRVTSRQHINEMIKRSIFPDTFADGKPFETGAFKHLLWPSTLNYINAQPDWSEEMKQDVIECYISFTNWLSYISFIDFHPDEIFHRNKVSPETNTPNFQDWRNFIEALGEQNKRDEIVARAIIQGQRRISEVISLTLNQIDYDACTINYISKNKTLAVCYEKSFINELKQYVQSTSKTRGNRSYVFITRTGKQITRRRLNYAFTHTCEQNRIKRKITPEILRTLWENFKQDKHRDSAIMHSKEERIRKSKEKRQLEVSNMPNIPEYFTIKESK